MSYEVFLTIGRVLSFMKQYLPISNQYLRHLQLILHLRFNGRDTFKEIDNFFRDDFLLFKIDIPDERLLQWVNVDVGESSDDLIIHGSGEFDEAT